MIVARTNLTAETHDMEPGSVTVWLQRLQERDPEAPRRIWDRYYAQMVRLARSRLRGVPAWAGDEEDVAAAAFHSFFRGRPVQKFEPPVSGHLTPGTYCSSLMRP